MSHLLGVGRDRDLDTDLESKTVSMTTTRKLKTRVQSYGALQNSSVRRATELSIRAIIKQLALIREKEQENVGRAREEC